MSGRRTRAHSPRPQPRSRYAVQAYTPPDLRLLASPDHFFFPSRHAPLLRLLTTPVVRYSPIHRIDYIHGLRTQRDIISFDIYPTCPHSLSANALLHEAAHNGTFDSANLENQLGLHVLALGLAPELHQFLSLTSKQEVDTAIIDFLVLLHHQLQSEGDIEGLRRLEEDLEPTIYNRLQTAIGVFPGGEPPAGRRANVLEQIVQLAFLTPWRVDVWGAYLTPTELRDLRSGIVVSGSIPAAKMVKDWVVYSDVLRNVAPDWGIADGLERAVSEGKSTQIFDEAKMVSNLAADVRCWLNVLPREIVDGCLIPWLVRTHCEALPSRRKRVAPLECTPAGVRFLDELEAAGEDVINRLATDRDGLSLWREWAAAHATGTEQKKDLCFSLDEKPWVNSADRVDVNTISTNIEDIRGFGSLVTSGSEELDDDNPIWRHPFIRDRHHFLL